MTVLVSMMETPQTIMQCQVGKKVAEKIYVHESALELLNPALADLARAALACCSEAASKVNVFKIDSDQRVVSLLSYPSFFDRPFPELAESWRVVLQSGRISYRTYSESLNPPILHRKELLLPLDHPRRDEYAQLTSQAEQIGLFVEPTAIGFRNHWYGLIRKAGYCLTEHHLQPLGNDFDDGVIAEEDIGADIQRHRTALSRVGLSAPMQALARHSLLDPQYSYFDYGCGRGDDLEALKAHGLIAAGWDPHFAPNQLKLTTDIVNLGFVINVIEDISERIDALRGAFALARQLLVVSTMLYTASSPLGRPFRDGYVTQRNTFQKYFTQGELKEFVETILDTDVIPVAPGIVFVFVDKVAEQRFLYGRQRNHYTQRLLGYRRVRMPVPRKRETQDELLRAEHSTLIAALWNCILEFGREPHQDEFGAAVEVVSVFGSWGRALRWFQSNYPKEELEAARAQRREDLLVYLALQLFASRPAYRQLQITLQRDIKAHFGDYQRARIVAQQFLQNVAVPAVLEAACSIASAKGLGYYQDSDYLQLHTSQIEQLPALLRIYIGCGAMLFGDLGQIDLVKIHVRSSKLTLMRFDDFVDQPLPRMLERIKITLRTQDIDFFTYGDSYEPPLLYFKSRYINEAFSHFAEQLAFDEALEELNLFDPDSHGLNERDLQQELSARRLEVCGFKLQDSTKVPELDAPCGNNFKYRDFIACGETWNRTQTANVPAQPATFNALYVLATQILDPVIDYFGMIRLTYGFASTALTQKITSRIAPRLDQHAACEINRVGKHICPRLGAAVDFYVEDEDMLEVAKWIAQNLTFDRMYFYGTDRPIHVSAGPDQERQVTTMIPRPGSDHLVPRTLTAAAFIQGKW